MSSNNDAENLLEAALYTAFTPTSIRKDVPQYPTSETGTDSHEGLAQPQPTGNPIDESKGSQEAPSDGWKEEYDAQVQKWRAKSAEAREKAEKERAKWEAIRAVQKEEPARREAGPEASEGENVTKGEHSPDMPVITSSEISEQHGEPEGPTQADMTDTSQNWEDIHSSATSSFPSMTFPERTATPSPPPARRQADISQTATLAAFDTSLSARTRIKAVLASLAINLLLPFVNGVMLGFGEVFAKNVIIGWFGWGHPGSIAGSKGLGASSRSQWRSR